MTLLPLILEFEVAVPPAQAFDAWTLRCASWWPKAHTVSGDPSAISFEPQAGGRIVEHGPDGTTHDWGRVLDWQPPQRVRYLWHMFFAPGDATEVEVTFTACGDHTAVRLEQRGFEALGAAGPPRRAKTEHVWATLTAAFADALAARPTLPSPEAPGAPSGTVSAL